MVVNGLLIQYFSAGMAFFTDVLKSRKLIWVMVKNDYRSRYMGSYLGIVWTFIQPAVTILVLWFVFETGFKPRPVNEVPFVLWLIAGMIPWFFLSEAIVSGTTSVVDQSFLVKKVVFRVSVLPVVKLCSALLVHLFFLLLMVGVFFLSGYPPNLRMFGVIYYTFAAGVLVLGITWLTSAVCVFIRDVTQIVNILIQLLFWLTPIFWSVSMVPEQYLGYLELNPMYYIVEGYRSCFVDSIIAPSLEWSVYFWLFSLTMLLSGAIVFKRLRQHFADVL